MWAWARQFGIDFLNRLPILSYAVRNRFGHWFQLLIRLNRKCNPCTHTHTLTHALLLHWKLMSIEAHRVFVHVHVFQRIKMLSISMRWKSVKTKERKNRPTTKTTTANSSSIDFHRNYGNTETELTACIIVHKLSGLSLWRVPHLPKQWAFIGWWFHLAIIFSSPCRLRDVARAMRILKLNSQR